MSNEIPFDNPPLISYILLSMKIIKVIVQSIMKHHYKYQTRDEWTYHYSIDCEAQIKSGLIQALEKFKGQNIPKKSLIKMIKDEL